MKTRYLYVLAGFLLLNCPFRGHAAGLFSGSFKGDNLTYDAQGDQNGYTGTMKLDDATFKFIAREKNGELQGTFESNGSTFDFNATLKGDTLSLTTGGTHYKLTRQAANPLAKKPRPDSTADKPASSDTAGKKEWENIYRNDAGESFRYPDGWKVRVDENAGAIYLTPADAGLFASEVIMVSGADGQGVTAPDDPRVMQAIEAIVMQGNPLMSRAGEPEKIKSGNRPAVQFTWGSSDIWGHKNQVRVLTTVLGKYVVSISDSGTKDQVAARNEILHQIFDTFDISGKPEKTESGGGTAKNDSGLVGTWETMDYKAVGGSSWTKVTDATLRADGSITISDNSESSHSFQYKNQQGDETGVAGGGSQSTSGTRGRWKAAGGKLTITLDSGDTAGYNYEIQPNSAGWPILRLHPADGGKLQEWSKK